MLNFICRRMASSAHARLFRLAAPLAYAWILAAPVAHAAEAMSMDAAATPSTPFSKYQNWRDEPLQDWKKANERVGEIGGWLIYLREAQQGNGGSDQSGQGQGHHEH